jgi:acetyl esterase/lipase
MNGLRVMLGALGLLALASRAVAADGQAGLKVDADGTVHIPAYAVPPSSYMTDQAKAVYAEAMRHPIQPVTDQGIQRYRESHNRLFYEPRLAKAAARYPVNIEDGTLGGVHVETITPRQGVARDKQDKVLIELHGGSFALGAVLGGRLESMPIAVTGGYRVVAVDYRQGPEHKFPAASEDVAAVYRDLLKRYKPENIGIFGCSGGGVLTAEATAWLQKQGLPRPGAIGIFCAPAESVAGGDARFWAVPLDVFFSSPPPPPAPNPPPFAMAYFSDADPRDPMVAPVWHLDVLAKFPPTLLVTGTRSLDMSGAAFTHTQLAKAGADSSFFAWEGMWHAFLYDVDVPEAQDAYAVIVKFFDRHLGKPAPQ